MPSELEYRNAGVGFGDAAVLADADRAEERRRNASWQDPVASSGHSSGGGYAPMEITERVADAIPGWLTNLLALAGAVAGGILFFAKTAYGVSLYTSFLADGADWLLLAAAIVAGGIAGKIMLHAILLILDAAFRIAVIGAAGYGLWLAFQWYSGS